MSGISFAGKKIVVTGAYSGIGASLVELLQELGASDITVLDLRRPEYPVTRFIQTDLGDPASIDSAVAEIGEGVDLLFNNAGIPGTFPAEQVMRVNLFGVLRLSRALLPTMVRGGAIVNTASTAGTHWAAHLQEILPLLQIEDWAAACAWVKEHAELVDNGYNFSKECMQVYTMYASREAWHCYGVRVNSVCPSPVDTPILKDFRATMSDVVIDLAIKEGTGSLSTPLQQAQVLAFLASDLASYVNGSNINVDGGFIAAVFTGQVQVPTAQ